LAEINGVRSQTILHANAGSFVKDLKQEVLPEKYEGQ